MKQIHAIDFDGTIYRGDSTVDFALYCFSKNLTLLKYAPKMISGYLKYKLKRITKVQFKEEFFFFLHSLDDVDGYIKGFWTCNEKKINEWYAIREHSTDVILSASPEFLLAPICKKLGVYLLIASLVDKNSGKFLSENCYGDQKVKRLQLFVGDFKIVECYSDSVSDAPLAKLAEKAYFVHKNHIKEWDIGRDAQC